ncbi:hypothetical protein NEIG_01212 [Nematocida sp. ERTm5]|nr:hypothetical protein NEIG_01212 [Nematocida sp. ERTm5]
MNLDEFIDSHVLNNTLLDSISDLVDIAGSTDIKRIIHKLKVKEQKSINYTTEFITQYVKSIESSESVSYKNCNMLSGNNCECKITLDSVNTQKTRNLLEILDIHRKNTSVVRSVLLKLLSVFTVDIDCSAIVVHLHTLEMDNDMPALLIDYAHVFYILGHHYESYQVLSLLSRHPSSSTKVNIMKLMMITKYLMSTNYRTHVNSIKILQGMDIQISPDKNVCKYMKYQKIITDYDKIIGHTSKNKKDVLMNHEVLDTLSEEEVKHWAWYTQEIKNITSAQDAVKEEVEDNKDKSDSDVINDLISKISFLRLNRLNYSLVDGKIHLEEGNSRNTFIDYVDQLDNVQPKNTLPTTGNSIRSDKAQNGMDGVVPSIPKNNENSKESLQPAVPKKRYKDKVTVLFERKEYMLRNTIKHYRNTVLTEKQADQTRSRLTELAVINNRFKLAKKKQLDMLEVIVNAYSAVSDISGVISKALAEKERIEKEEAKKIKEEPTEQEKEPVQQTTTSTSEMNWDKSKSEAYTYVPPIRPTRTYQSVWNPGHDESTPREEREPIRRSHWKSREETEGTSELVNNDNSSGIYKVPDRPSTFINLSSISSAMNKSETTAHREESSTARVWNKGKSEDTTEKSTAYFVKDTADKPYKEFKAPRKQNEKSEFTGNRREKSKPNDSSSTSTITWKKQ